MALFVHQDTQQSFRLPKCGDQTVAGTPPNTTDETLLACPGADPAIAASFLKIDMTNDPSNEGFMTYFVPPCTVSGQNVGLIMDQAFRPLIVSYKTTGADPTTPDDGKHTLQVDYIPKNADGTVNKPDVVLMRVVNYTGTTVAMTLPTPYLCSATFTVPAANEPFWIVMPAKASGLTAAGQTLSSPFSTPASYSVGGASGGTVVLNEDTAARANTGSATAPSMWTLSLLPAGTAFVLLAFTNKFSQATIERTATVSIKISGGATETYIIVPGERLKRVCVGVAAITVTVPGLGETMTIPVNPPEGYMVGKFAVGITKSAIHDVAADILPGLPYTVANTAPPASDGQTVHFVITSGNVTSCGTGIEFLQGAVTPGGSATTYCPSNSCIAFRTQDAVELTKYTPMPVDPGPPPVLLPVSLPPYVKVYQGPLSRTATGLIQVDTSTPPGPGTAGAGSGPGTGTSGPGSGSGSETSGPAGPSGPGTWPSGPGAWPMPKPIPKPVPGPSPASKQATYIGIGVGAAILVILIVVAVVLLTKPGKKPLPPGK